MPLVKKNQFSFRDIILLLEVTILSSKFRFITTLIVISRTLRYVFMEIASFIFLNMYILFSSLTLVAIFYY